MNFKLETITYKALASGSPAYLSSLLTLYSSPNLRSSDQLLLQCFTTKSNFGSRAFVLLLLLFETCYIILSELLVFYLPLNVLKTYYFQSSFHPSL